MPQNHKRQWISTTSEKTHELPSMDKQIAIVKKLDLISDTIAIYTNQIENLDNLVKARFIEMFGDPIDNPREYPVHQLSEYIMSLTSGSRGWAKYCVDDGDEWFITIKNVKDCHIFTDNMQSVNAPDNAEAKRTKVLKNLEAECDSALQQIDDRMYAKDFEDAYDDILCYGISFFKTRCMVKKK